MQRREHLGSDYCFLFFLHHVRPHTDIKILNKKAILELLLIREQVTLQYAQVTLQNASRE